MEQGFWWNWWVQVAVAVGTVAAALVALFGEAARARFFPPLLRLQLLSREGEYCPVQINSASPGGEPQMRPAEGRYYHLVVTNGRRWSPARNVQVFLTMVETPDANGVMRTEWTGSVPMRWRHQEVFPLTRTIGPAADCDLLAVVETKWVELMPLLAPFNLIARRRGACHMALTLEARSNEVNSPPMRVEIHWNGKWDKGTTEMTRHLVIKAAP